MKRLLLIAIIVIIPVAVVMLLVESTDHIDNSTTTSDLAPITEPFEFQDHFGTLMQVPCEYPGRRPIAVMLSSDKEARPLSGISSADVIIEMPVVTGLITRIMALFQCEDIEEIGSVRSSRHDFIPLASSFDALYAHWGGSVLALRELNKGVIDNIDAMVNVKRTYWEKSGIRAPHAGFTSSEKLLETAEYLGFRLTASEPPFYMEPQENEKNEGTIIVGYPGTFIVSYYYNPDTGLYERFRDGTPELDALDGKQVEVSNVVVMKAASQQVLDDYNDVTLEGSGEVTIYRNGKEIEGFWKYQETIPKIAPRFFDLEGREISLQPGKTWISIIEPEQIVAWVTK